MEKLKSTYLNYFSTILSHISNPDHTDTDLNKDKLKQAYLSKEDFISALKKENILSLIDHYFTREETQQGLLYAILNSPTENLAKTFKDLAKVEKNKFEQNFNETILIQTTPPKVCLVSSLLASPLESTVSIIDAISELQETLKDTEHESKVPFNKLNINLHNMANQISLLLLSHMDLLEQLSFIQKEDSMSLKLYLEQLQIETERLKRIKFNYSESWEIFSVKSTQLIKSIESLEAITKTIIKEYSSTITKTNFVLTKNQKNIEHYKKTFFAHLNNKSYSLGDITNAWTRIFVYCKKANITASDLLIEENQLISPIIDKELIEKMKKIDMSAEVGVTLKEEKMHNLKFLKSIKTILSVLCILIFMGSCGLKTEPKSNIPDLEPSIPYKAAEPSEDTQKQNKTKGESSDSMKPN